MTVVWTQTIYTGTNSGGLITFYGAVLEMETILIVDDHPVVLDGLVMMLRDQMPDGELITAADGCSARTLVARYQAFDWIFLDVNLPDDDGIELLKEFATCKVTANVIILSSDNNPAIVDRALNQNASGFLSKSFDSIELRACVDTIKQGKIYLSPEFQHKLDYYRKSILAEKNHIEESLSKRQRQTLLLMAEGYSNREIARSFGIVESTVKSHVQALFLLFEADNRTHCVSEARRINII